MRGLRLTRTAEVATPPPTGIVLGMTNYDRTTEAPANDRARQLLTGTGMTIATMDAATYDRIKAQLKRERLWV